MPLMLCNPRRNHVDPNCIALKNFYFTTDYQIAQNYRGKMISNSSKGEWMR